jgi:hypothetical protein
MHQHTPRRLAAANGGKSELSETHAGCDRRKNGIKRQLAWLTTARLRPAESKKK